MTRSILLTGAFGFLGRRVLRRAAEVGSDDAWIAACPRELPTRGPVPSRFSVVTVDLDDFAGIEALVLKAKPDVVLHLAAALTPADTPQNRERLFRVNVAGTANLVHVVSRRRWLGQAPAHVVFLSTGLVYGDVPAPYRETMPAAPRDVYGMSKFLGEQTLQAHAQAGTLDGCVLRAPILYGPGQSGAMFVPSLIAALARKERFPMTGGEQTRDFVFVDDMVEALHLAIEARLSGIYNVGTGKGVPIREVGELIARLMGAPELLGIGDIRYRAQEAWTYALDASRLRDKGWKPSISLEEGIRRTIAASTLRD